MLQTPAVSTARDSGRSSSIYNSPPWVGGTEPSSLRCKECENTDHATLALFRKILLRRDGLNLLGDETFVGYIKDRVSP